MGIIEFYTTFSQIMSFSTILCKQECLICDHFPATINLTATADLCLFRFTLQGLVHRESTLFITPCNTLTYTFVMHSI